MMMAVRRLSYFTHKVCYSKEELHGYLRRRLGHREAAVVKEKSGKVFKGLFILTLILGHF